MISLLIATALAQPKLPLATAKVETASDHQSAQSTIYAAANGYPIARQVQIGANEVLQPQDIRSLPGGLDTVPLFNSNSPEVVRQPGILLSTFPSAGKRFPNAHLNFGFKGRFDVFAHHIARTDQPDTTPTVYNAILVYNPSSTHTVNLDILQAASFLGTPDAPYITLPAMVQNPIGRVFSGPGARVMDAVLRSNRQPSWPSRISIAPKSSELLMNLPVPVPRPAATRIRMAPVGQVLIPSLLQHRRMLAGTGIRLNRAPSSNARSTMMRLQSSDQVHMAYLAMHAPVFQNGQEGIPAKQAWENLLVNSPLVRPRDITPSPLNSSTDPFFYGRVAGVSKGSQWQAKITDTPRNKRLTLPKPGQAFSYGLSTLQRGTFGTQQIQSAPMLARYSDTAFLAHGNYGVHYQLKLPLYNASKENKRISLTIQTPVKQDLGVQGLRFLRALSGQIFFRGTVRVQYRDDANLRRVLYYHLHQRQGQQGEPLALLNLDKKEERLVELDYMYPPDATPPQVLTVQTLENLSQPQQAAYDPQPR
jgi:hypothetical protein